ncbi:hypothetical protein ACOMHN_046682 [Nucella lapillus]
MDKMKNFTTMTKFTSLTTSILTPSAVESTPEPKIYDVNLTYVVLFLVWCLLLCLTILFGWTCSKLTLQWFLNNTVYKNSNNNRKNKNITNSNKNITSRNKKNSTTSNNMNKNSRTFVLYRIPRKVLSAILHRPQPSDEEGQVNQIRLIEADPECDPVYRAVTVPLTSQSVHVQHE